MSGVGGHPNQWSGPENAVAHPQLESLEMKAGQRGLQEQWAWSWGALWWAPPMGGHHDKAPNALTVARVQPIRTMN